MSTRAAIARPSADGFAGRYHHWDGYPTGLGKTLWDALQHTPAPALMAFLIDAHPSGWSTINDANLALEPGYDPPLSRGPAKDVAADRRAQCYCHGDRHDDEWLVTHENASGSGVEFVYVIDEQSEQFTVMETRTGDTGAHMTGMFGMGDPKGKFRILWSGPIHGPEPDWGAINEIAGFLP